MTLCKRNEIQVIQFSWRGLFVNSVLRVHEARLGLVDLAGSINACLVKLGPQTEATAVRAIVALQHMLRSAEYKNADAILNELEHVNGLIRQHLLESVRSIFLHKKHGMGIFADSNFTASLLFLRSPEWWQEELAAAAKSAWDVRKEMEDIWSEYISARSKMNVSQFTRRMEEAWAANDDAKAEAIRLERKNAEARLFVVASRYVATYSKVLEAEKKLQEAFDKAASFVDGTRNDVDIIKAMTHALGAWHALGELRIYIKPKYEANNPQYILDELEFDAAAYIKG